MLAPFQPRTLVNGGMLCKHVGQNVGILLRIQDETGLALKAISTDKQTIRVKLSEPTGARQGCWVEIIGEPTAADAIDAKEVMIFAEENPNFDEGGYNAMVEFLNNCKEVFRNG